MFAVTRIGNLTNKGDKLVTGSVSMFTDMGGAGSYSNTYNGQVFTYTQEEMNSAITDDINYDDMTPEQQELFKKAQAEPTTDAQQEANTVVNNSAQPVTTGCDDITGDVSGDYQLSTHFKLKDFTTNVAFGSGYTIRPQGGRTAAQIICNLKAVAVNCGETLVAHYGRVNINSGFRHGAGTGSQHEKGQAADFQFQGLSQDEIWNRANWIKDNVPFDQFILEYSDTTNNCWFHLSFNREGNRKKVNTYHKSFNTVSGGKIIKNYPSGLRKMR